MKKENLNIASVVLFIITIFILNTGFLSSIYYNSRSSDKSEQKYTRNYSISDMPYLIFDQLIEDEEGGIVITNGEITIYGELELPRFVVYAIILTLILITLILPIIGLIMAMHGKKICPIIFNALLLIYLVTLKILALFEAKTHFSTYQIKNHTIKAKMSPDFYLVALIIIVNIVIIAIHKSSDEKNNNYVYNTNGIDVTSNKRDNINVGSNIQQNISVNALDEIRKLKELLDMEVITQEEFEKKKKEYL